MSCEVAESPLPQNDWLTDVTQHDSASLDAIADFNASLADNQGHVEAEMHFDPSSSLFEFQPTALGHGSFGMPHQQQSSNPGSPYYFSSIEAPFDSSLMAHHSHLQNVHRRSISEPPMDMSASHDFHGLPTIPEPSVPTQITFHRGGHYLGRPQQARLLKSLPKGKSGPKGQAYKLKGKEAYQIQHVKPRYQVRPSMHRAPTSAPMMYEPQMQAVQHSFQSTRVCTPEPGDVIDPQLDGSIQGRDKAGIVTLPVSMEELKRMIETAVQSAVWASRENKRSATEGGKVREGAEEVF